MGKIAEFKAIRNGDKIEIENTSFPDLFSHVMDRHVAIIHNVFPTDQLRALHAAIHAWGLATPVTPPQTYIDETFHSIESGISPRQGTSHNYHAYNFNKITALPADLSEKLLGVFQSAAGLPERADRPECRAGKR